MKKKRLQVFGSLFVLTVFVVFLSTTSSADTIRSTERSIGQIYLYGEHHGVEKILEKELMLWNKYYHEENMRHLFVEYAYYTAEFLNLWMQSDNDDILDKLYEDWSGTAAQNPHIKAFFKAIKAQCPETIFHGTDVGHQYHTTGQRFLEYLKKNGFEGTENYILTQEAIEQGKHYYDYSDNVYRENKMVENFIREFDKLTDESVMGIYGGAHTDFYSLDYMTYSVPSMANQLKERYGDAIFSENLALDTEPFRVDIITIDGKDFEASYFGKQDLTGFKDFAYREFWRLENAYEYFNGYEKTGDVLPYNNYPMPIEVSQVFVIELTKIDGSVMRLHHRSDGSFWNGLPSTEGFVIE